MTAGCNFACYKSNLQSFMFHAFFSFPPPSQPVLSPPHPFLSFFSPSVCRGSSCPYSKKIPEKKKNTLPCWVFFFFFFFRNQFSTRNKLDIKRKRKEKKKKISCISLRCSRSSPPPESQSIFTVILCGRSRIACPLLHLRGSRTPRADETLPSIQMHAEPPCRSTPPWKPERETNELGKWLTSHLRTTEGEAGGLIQAGVWQAGEHSRGRIALTLAQTSLIY